MVEEVMHKHFLQYISTYDNLLKFTAIKFATKWLVYVYIFFSSVTWIWQHMLKYQNMDASEEDTDRKISGLKWITVY